MATPSDAGAPRLELSYQLLFEHNPLPMWVYDADTLRLLAVNQAAVEHAGYTQPEFVGLTLADLHHPDDVPAMREHLSLSMSERAVQRSWRLRHRNGGWIEIETQTRELALDGMRAHLVLARDLTAPRLPGEQETLSTVINSTNDAIISVDTEGLVKTFNPGAERIFRRTGASLQGHSMEVLLPERFRAAHRQHLRRFAESGTSSRMMGLGLVKGLRSDGQEIDLEGTISQVSVLRQQVLIVSLRDVTERVRAHDELQQSRARLTELTHKLLSQEKTLVKRLSQALHDQLGQTMTAIRMVHEAILATQRDNPSPDVLRLEQQLGSLISQGMRQIRQVLVDLRPPLLEEQGLASALDNELLNRSLTQPQVDISIDVKPEIALMRWPAEVEYAAFMIAREAVENALRHSGASCVAVRLSGGGLSLLLEVADNGVGIPDGGAPRSGHLGILGMHERAHAIGANVTFSSGDKQGACVSFHWEPAS